MPYAYAAVLLAEEQVKQMHAEQQYNQWMNQLQMNNAYGSGGNGSGGGVMAHTYGNIAPRMNLYAQEALIAASSQAAKATYPDQEPNLLLLLDDP